MSRIDWRTDSGAEMWWLDHASGFEFRLKRDEHEFNDVVFEIATRGHGRWAVTHHGSVLDKKVNGFVYEPLNSSRTKAFFNACRYDSKEDALKALQKFVATHVFMGGGYRAKTKAEIKADKAAAKAAKAKAE